MLQSVITCQDVFDVGQDHLQLQLQGSSVPLATPSNRTLYQLIKLRSIQY